LGIRRPNEATNAVSRSELEETTIDVQGTTYRVRNDHHESAQPVRFSLAAALTRTSGHGMIEGTIHVKLE